MTSKIEISDLFLEVESPFDFNKTIESIQQEIDRAGWKLPALHDLQLTMKNFGKEVYPVKVFEICHPDLSSKILEKSDERIASVMMPCRISVYMKHNQKTYVSLINTAGFAQNTNHLINEVMTQASAGAEKIVENALKKKP